MRHTKAKAAWLLALLLVVFVAQTASACEPQEKLLPDRVYVQVGETVTVNVGDVAIHESTCNGSEIDLLFYRISLAPDGSTATATLGSGGTTIEITGVAQGSTAMLAEVMCIIDHGFTDVPIFIRVDDAPTPPQPKPAHTTPNDSGDSFRTPEKTLEKATIGNCQEWVNVYVGPSTKQKVVGKAFLGEAIELIQWNHNETFCKVFYNGGDNLGWVQGKYIIPQK